MKLSIRVLPLAQLICCASVYLIGGGVSTFAQDCGCTVAEVLENTVTPCAKTIGTEVVVASASEFRSAISMANNNGGNMTILIADGTYEVASTSSYPYITASNLVIRSQSGNRDAVILTGGGMRAVSSTEIGLFLVGDNITVADLTIRGVGNHAIAMNSNDHLIHNVRLQDAYEQLLKGTSADGGSDNVVIQCNLFEYTAGIGPQFYIGGIDIHDGDNCEVRDNAFYDIASPSGSLAEHAIHFWNNSSNTLVERNLIVNCDRGVGFGLGSSAHSGGIIRNNMIYNDGGHPFDDVGIGLETSPLTEVYNNTVRIVYQNAIEYRFAETFDVVIANNLTNRAITARNGGQATVTNNFTAAQDGWFEDLTAGNLRLNDAYPDVIDQGMDLPNEVADDIDQTSRLVGLYDIGAHEYPESTADVQVSGTAICLFPNPVVGEFTVKGLLSDYTIDILDAQGQLHESIDTSGSSITIDVNTLPAGLYFISITSVTGEQQHLQQMIKM